MGSTSHEVALDGNFLVHKRFHVTREVRQRQILVRNPSYEYVVVNIVLFHLTLECDEFNHITLIGRHIAFVNSLRIRIGHGVA